MENIVKKVVKSAENIIKSTPKFTKEALIHSKRYNTKRDAIELLVKPDEKLTIEEMDKRLKEFYEKGAK